MYACIGRFAGRHAGANISMVCRFACMLAGIYIYI